VVGYSYTLSSLGGSGEGISSETLTGVSTASNCAISGHTLSASASSGQYCQVLFTKAASQNYLIETATAYIYFFLYAINQPSPSAGAGPTIALGGQTSLTLDPNAAPTITSFGASGDATYPIAINGAGFTAASAGTTTVKFWRNQVVSVGDFTIKSDILIWTKQPVGATTGKIIVINNNGIASSTTNFTP
jgi:hypothetical protein